MPNRHKRKQPTPERYGTATVRSAKLEPGSGHEPLEASKVKAFDTPVSIAVHNGRNRLIDLDNISIKAVLDGIVIAGLLRDDSPQWVSAIEVTQEKCTGAKKEETIITLTEIRK